MKFSRKEENLKTIKAALLALGIMLITLLCLGIYVSINNFGSLSFIVVPFILSPILYVFAKKTFTITEEIKSREI
ncbi:hypothetical protein [Labilibaculum antarcticum]|nr:hypothetical protein [Labilibaculum antarcticum]